MRWEEDQAGANLRQERKSSDFVNQILSYSWNSLDLIFTKYYLVEKEALKFHYSKIVKILKNQIFNFLLLVGIGDLYKTSEGPKMIQETPKQHIGIIFFWICGALSNWWNFLHFRIT